MKNATTIKSLLGFTQEETAILLGVSRGQWSMYVAGKRDLPSDAKKQFIAMLSLQNAKAAFHEKDNFLKSEQKKTQEWLKQELSNLQFKKKLLDKQLPTIKNKKTILCFHFMLRNFVMQLPRWGLLPLYLFSFSFLSKQRMMG